MATKAGVKLDQDKIRMDLVPPELIEEVGKVLTFGAKKYTPNGWKTVPNSTERYMAALLRHLMSHQKGEANDPESGLSHLSHAATNIAFLIHLQAKKEEPTTEKVV